MKNMVCPETESESVSLKRKKVMIMKELVKGQEAATQLMLLLENPSWSDTDRDSLSSQELMANVLTSFTQALSIITASADDVIPPLNLHSSGDDQCSGSGKRSQKGGRGRYHRRRSALTWTVLSSTTEDNHAWRKYGQKGILNSEFPRSYLRCSHKYDQGCKATKQVQRCEENPDMYQTTYIGMHTCNAKPPKATHSTTNSTTWESYLLNSDRDSKVPNVHDHHSPSLTIKREFPKENTSSDVTDHNLDPSLWSELKDFESSIQPYH
ncbi:probable WRKY transcription factor 70 [Cajanus cajan]|nr:probable WRKY transcription factor 70 [Cajanus cajan]